MDMSMDWNEGWEINGRLISLGSKKTERFEAWKEISANFAFPAPLILLVCDYLKIYISSIALYILAKCPISALSKEVSLAKVTGYELGIDPDKFYTYHEVCQAALRCGFEICGKDIAYLLRLDYLRQPMGELVYVGTIPICFQGKEYLLYIGNLGEMCINAQECVAGKRFYYEDEFIFVLPKDRKIIWH